MIEAATWAACKQINYSLSEEAQKKEFVACKPYYTDVGIETLKAAFKELPEIDDITVKGNFIMFNDAEFKKLYQALKEWSGK